MERVFPAGLKQGDTISIVAPAGPVDRTKLQRAMAALQSLGFRIRTYRDIYQRRGYLAGSDQQRTDELMQAFRDPESQAVFPARGGYGCMRIVDQLDYGDIRANPKVFVGFSDNTALHAALFKRAGLVTFHGPHPSDSYGREEGVSPLSANWLWRALLCEQYRDSEKPGYLIELPPVTSGQLCTMSPGIARGRLVGGNLALVCAVLGTPYDFATAANILFLEDTNEPPYRIDRFFAQLRAAGKLDGIAGLVLGQFTDWKSDEGPSLSLPQVFDDYLSELSCPILTNFPSGHQQDNVTLPLHVDLEIDTDRKQLTVLEDPVDLS